MRFLSLSILLAFCSFSVSAGVANTNTITAQPITIVPSGMRTVAPIISDETFARIAKKNDLSDKSFGEEDLKKLDSKFEKVIAKLQKGRVFDKIAVISKKYGVKPETVAACIIGEHVFNVGLVDDFQNYFIRVYSRWIDKYDPAQNVYIEFIKEPEVAEILALDDISDYEKWDKIFELYNTKYKGTNDYPNTSFLMAFFNPLRAGLTYGLGQLSPTRVLLTNDIAVKLGGLPKIDPSDTDLLYQATLDVDTNINYVTASVVAEIINYKKYANLDISRNIGIVATLYNLGEEKRRAIRLGKINTKLLKDKKEIELPKENFYGWFMNKKEEDIKALFTRKI